MKKLTDEEKSQPPQFIAVEGPIGVGKTTLAKRLADTFSCKTLLEQPEENPFLERFYQDQKTGALPTQLYFLFQRVRKIQEIRQSDMFQKVQIADFLMEKDQLFAQITLDSEELKLYQAVYKQLMIDAPKPDLVIYLQAPIEILKERITKRGNINEQYLTLDYLEKLNDAYSRFFLDYKSAPLLIINAADINLESNDADYEALVTMIMSNPKGKNFVNPQPSII